MVIFQLNDDEIKSLYLAVREKGLSEGKALEEVLAEIVYGKDIKLALKGIRIFYAITMAGKIDYDFLFEDGYDEPAEIIPFPID